MSVTEDICENFVAERAIKQQQKRETLIIMNIKIDFKSIVG